MIRPLYKVREPFMEVKSGHGYMGVVMYDDKEDKLQCHICGEWYAGIGQHVNQSHKILCEEYREEFGLPMRGGLISKSAASKMSIASSRPENIKRLSKHRIMVWQGDKKVISARKKRLSLIVHTARQRIAAKNKIGLCDAQKKARYDVVGKIVGHEPTAADLIKYDHALAGYLANEEVGGLNGWRSRNGHPTRKQGNSILKYENLELIAGLRKWAKRYAKIPSAQDFNYARNGYPSSTPMLRAFGSWQNALMQAGLR